MIPSFSAAVVVVGGGGGVDGGGVYFRMCRGAVEGERERVESRESRMTFVFGPS